MIKSFLQRLSLVTCMLSITNFCLGMTGPEQLKIDLTRLETSMKNLKQKLRDFSGKKGLMGLQESLGKPPVKHIGNTEITEAIKVSTADTARIGSIISAFNTKDDEGKKEDKKALVEILQAYTMKKEYAPAFWGQFSKKELKFFNTNLNILEIDEEEDKDYQVIFKLTKKQEEEFETALKKAK